MKRRMNFKQWWDTVGTVNVMRVAARLNTSVAYLKHLRYGTKVPSDDYAERIIAAAQAVTPGFAPDPVLLRNGVKRVGRVNRIEPAPEVVAAQKAARKRNSQ
jgi:hypothetical protein